MRKFSQILLMAGSLFQILSCGHRSPNQLRSEIKSLNLAQGEITLCGAGQFGTVLINQACSEKVKDDFNLATALLHSFEYSEAEKVFSKVIAADPECVMGYWGAAMCSFHPLWERPGEKDLKKGAQIIKVGRSVVKDSSSRESHYLEAIATIFDHWDLLDHQARVLKFEHAALKTYQKYPDDVEAQVFYALALRAASSPKDKSFVKQKKAGDLLQALFVTHPDHPGIAHYIIHTYDYPELATLALPAARKYASIAAASAHAQHMPSHIFTRLGLWDESISSNLSSISAAQCYAEKMKMDGHWDEELHGLDYLMFAYLQKGDDKKATELLSYFQTIKAVFPEDGKDAFSFAAMPSRFVIERRDWKAAAALALSPVLKDWDHYKWESANVTFGKLLGSVHTKNLPVAKEQLSLLKDDLVALTKAKELYKADFLQIQVEAGEAWIALEEGKSKEAIILMKAAAAREDNTEKHPVSPGEIISARELLGDMYAQLGDHANALAEYEADIKRHPHHFNPLFGAAQSAEKLKDFSKAELYYNQLKEMTLNSNCERPEIGLMNDFLRRRGHLTGS